jgi:DNA-binding response OmpR family regulator
VSRLLLVDDSFAARFGVRRALHDMGYVVDEATTLTETLELLASAKYDGMVLDWSLTPFGNEGERVLQELGRLPRARRPVVVVVTAIDDPGVESRALALGARRVFVKPVSVEILAAWLPKPKRRPKAPVEPKRKQRKRRSK